MNTVEFNVEHYVNYISTMTQHGHGFDITDVYDDGAERLIEKIKFELPLRVNENLIIVEFTVYGRDEGSDEKHDFYSLYKNYSLYRGLHRFHRVYLVDDLTDRRRLEQTMYKTLTNIKVLFTNHYAACLCCGMEKLCFKYFCNECTLQGKEFCKILTEDCPICKEPLSVSYRTTPCNHTFHSKCITTWMREQRSCPLCRADI
jgi:hypothetical protein